MHLIVFVGIVVMGLALVMWLLTQLMIMFFSLTSEIAELGRGNAQRGVPRTPWWIRWIGVIYLVIGIGLPIILSQC